MSEKPTVVVPGNDYLDQFSRPLWRLLDLSDCKPDRVVEGVQDGYPYMVIDLLHADFGLFSNTSSSPTETTTFFVIRLPVGDENKRIQWIPEGFQASMDAEFLYIGAPKRKVSPAQWRDSIQDAIRVVRCLGKAIPHTKGQNTSMATYSPVGPGVVQSSFLGVILLSLGFLMVSVGHPEGMSFVLGAAYFFWRVWRLKNR